jgi:hypothetical protein
MSARRPRRPSRILAALALALASAALPACRHAELREGRQAFRPAAPTVPYSAYRPAYSPGPPRRTLFLGGYAGYNYSDAPPRGYVPTSRGAEAWGYPTPHHEGIAGH